MYINCKGHTNYLLVIERSIQPDLILLIEASESAFKCCIGP